MKGQVSEGATNATPTNFLPDVMTPLREFGFWVCWPWCWEASVKHGLAINSSPFWPNCQLDEAASNSVFQSFAVA